MEDKVANMAEFHNKSDFTVNIQPFTRNLVFPSKLNGDTDFTYMSTDCFHMSQRGYALAANAVWNNMLEPYGNKTLDWGREFKLFRCPTTRMPYLSTRENSS